MIQQSKNMWVMSVLMIISMLIGNQSIAHAQDATANFVLDLAIQINGEEPIPQSDYVFDIIQRDAQGKAIDNAQVYRYDRTDPNYTENIQLPEGTYTFRLYDGMQPNFTRDGKPIRTKLVKESVANPQAGQETMTDLSDQGSLNDWGNGTQVYDWNFTITADHVQDGQYQLQIVLADEVSLAMTEESTQADASSEATTLDATSETTTSEASTTETLTEDSSTTPSEQTNQEDPAAAGMVELPFEVLDNHANPVEGVMITVNDQSVTTDAQGKANITVPAGNLQLAIAQVPQGYEGVGAFDPITVEPGRVNPIALTVNQLDQTQAVMFTVVDDQGIPVPQVEIQMAEETAITDANGQVTFATVALGEQTYVVTKQPEGFALDKVEGKINVTADAPVQETLTMTKEAVNGTLTLSAKNDQGQPVPGLGLVVNDQEYQTDDQGQVTIADLPAGNYDVTFTAIPEGYQAPEMMAVTIQSGQETAESINLGTQEKPQGSLSIKVEDQNQQPLANVDVVLNDDQTLTTNDQGMISLDALTPGSYTLDLPSLPQGYKLQSPNQTVQIQEEKETQHVITVEKETPKRQLSVFIHDQNNEPVSGVALKVADQTLKTDSQGQIQFKDLTPGTLDYTVVSVPDKYLGDKSGQVTIPEQEDASLDITIEKEIKPAKVQVNVTDQDGNSVSGVNVQFGGLLAATNDQGQIIWEELSPGNYQYQFGDLPEGYHGISEGGNKELKEEESFVLDLQVEKLPDQGAVKIKVLDDQNKPVANATVEIADQTIKTDDNGIANVGKIQKGEHDLTIISAPKDYELNQQSQTVNVRANQTVNVEMKVAKQEETTTTSTEQTTQASKDKQDAAKTSQTTQTSTAKDVTLTIQQEKLSPEEEQKVSEEAKNATRQFKDPQTGIEVWVNPQDAGKADRLVVKKLQGLQSLASLDADAYELSLVDDNHQLIQLSKVAEVKIPTRPVNQQLKVIRVDGNDLSSLTFALQNQRTSFRTQQLGTFAVSYGSQASQPESSQTTSTSQQDVKVTKQKGVEQKGLPGTGEKLSWLTLVFAVIAIVAGIAIWKSQKRED